MPFLKLSLTTVMTFALLAGLPALGDEPRKIDPPAVTTAGTSENGPQNPASAADKTSAEHLRTRVDLFWSSRVAQKYDVCYNLLTKESRDKLTMVNYIQRINNRTTGFEVSSIQLDPANPAHAEVLVLYRLSFMGYKMEHVKYHQHWYVEDGDWYAQYIVKTPFDAKARKVAEEQAEGDAGAAPAGKSAEKAEGQTDAKPEDAELSAQRKQRIQELLEKIKKSRNVTKPSLNEAIAPPPPAAPAGTTPPAAHGTSSSPADGATSGKKVDTGADKEKNTATTETGAAEKPAGKKTKPASEPAKTDPAKSGGDPKK
jgi:hypothetical protein